MPYFEQGNVKTYYEDNGKGEPIITNHGVREDGGYWRVGGVTAALAEKYRVISMDMRCHGRTVVGKEPWGFDVETMAADIDALADHLKLEKFHLLSHATGGMVAARYGMRHSDRLLSLILTDTGSATRPTLPGMGDVEQYMQRMAEARKWMEEHPNPSDEERLARWVSNPDVWTFTIAQRREPERSRMRIMMEGFETRRLKENTDRLDSIFFPSFYTDPDPHIDELKKVSCPALILLGEHDVVFLGPSEVMARAIPINRHVLIKGAGHMTAIEAPEETAHELLFFLECVRTGIGIQR
jgi:pimeloyl-ACP methyl ester carboxylesterase